MRKKSNNAFLIEKYRNSLKKNANKVKSVEIVLPKDKNLYFIEAKSTFPNPSSEESDSKFKEGIESIVEKFIHSLNLYCSILVGIGQRRMPMKFSELSKKLILVLIIKKHRKDWLRPIRNGICEKLPEYFKKIWEPEVYVLNYDLAIGKGFVVKDVPKEANIINR